MLGKKYMWVFLVFSLTCFVGAAEVFIYNTTLAKPASVEKDLSGKMGGAEVKVFARFVDLKTMIDKNKPAVIIAPEITLKALKLDKGIKASGVVGGATSQEFILVSIDTEVDLVANPEAKIGALDVAGRKGMKDLMESVVGEKAKYKSVTKLEDLVPMLTFKSADAVLITPADLELLKSKTKANLKVKNLSGKKTGNQSVAVDAGSPDAGGVEGILGAIKKLSAKELKVLGVESWK